MANTTRIPKGKKRVMITLDEKTLNLIKEASEKNYRTVSSEIALLINEKYGSKEK